MTDQGGPCENILPDETGLVVEGGSTDSLLAAMESLVRHSNRRIAMGQGARRSMKDRSFEAAFNETWGMLSQIQLGSPDRASLGVRSSPQ